MDALADTTTWYYYDDQRRRQYTAGWVPSSLQIWGNFYAFTGRELDWLDGGNLQVMYYRARYYDPDTGRFLQHDPLGIDPAGGSINPFSPKRQYTDGMNLYEYGKTNAIVNIDPRGLITEDECWKNYQDQYAKIINQLASCTQECFGVLGVGVTKCALGCVLTYVAGGKTIAYKTCIKACGGCLTLISLVCENYCLQQFNDSRESSINALQRCRDKAKR